MKFVLISTPGKSRDMAISDNIIPSKINCPLVDKGHIARPYLFHQLNTFPHRQATLVSAPAGYGKSSLVIDWLDTINNPIAWVSLDKGDNDVRQFLNYTLASLRSCAEAENLNCLTKTMNMAQAIALPPLSVLVGSLLRLAIISMHHQGGTNLIQNFLSRR